MKPYIVVLMLLWSVPAMAQQQPPPAGKPTAKPPTPPSAPTLPTPPKPAVPIAPMPPAVIAGDPYSGAQAVNIRVDVSVSDQTDSGASQPKTLMVILADRAMGSTRAAYQDRSILVDARPTIVDGLIRVSVTVKSAEPDKMMLPGEPFKGPDPLLNWTNSFTLLLQSAKPVVAMETSDAVTKRKMSIEVKATIQK
jgi:hypothetical protein